MQFLYHIHSIISLCFFNNINIGGKYFDFPWYLKKDHTIINTSVYTETVNCWRYNWEISNKLILKIVHCIFFKWHDSYQKLDSKLLKIDKKSYKHIDIY